MLRGEQTQLIAVFHGPNSDNVEIRDDNYKEIQHSIVTFFNHCHTESMDYRSAEQQKILITFKVVTCDILL